jgi:methylmalonyl-CoA mutase
MVAAFKSSGTPLACLCSSDAIYEREATDAAKALRGDGVTLLFLAGQPNDALESAGVQEFVYAGCDALAALRKAHARLGL